MDKACGLSAATPSILPVGTSLYSMPGPGCILPCRMRHSRVVRLWQRLCSHDLRLAMADSHCRQATRPSSWASLSHCLMLVYCPGHTTILTGQTLISVNWQWAASPANSLWTDGLSCARLSSCASTLEALLSHGRQESHTWVCSSVAQPHTLGMSGMHSTVSLFASQNVHYIPPVPLVINTAVRSLPLADAPQSHQPLITPANSHSSMAVELRRRIFLAASPSVPCSFLLRI